MSMTQHWTVIGIFENQTSATQGIEALHNAGFSHEQIGFVSRHDHGTQKDVPLSVREAETRSEEGTGVVTSGIIGGILGAADALLTPVLGSSVANTIPTAGMPLAEQAVENFQNKGTLSGSQETEHDERETLRDARAEKSADIHKTRIDVGEGAVTGGIVGGVLGAAAVLLLPVIGPIFAGGILITALGGAALGAVTGGLLGAFVHMGVPEEQAHRYENEFKAGRTIVTVKTDDHQQEALDILYNNGAIYANAHGDSEEK